MIVVEIQRQVQTVYTHHCHRQGDPGLEGALEGDFDFRLFSPNEICLCY